MKKRFFYLFPLFILLLFVVCSCKDDNNEPTPPEPSPEITIPSSENLNPVLSQEGWYGKYFIYYYCRLDCISS